MLFLPVCRWQLADAMAEAWGDVLGAERRARAVDVIIYLRTEAIIAAINTTTFDENTVKPSMVNTTILYEALTRAEAMERRSPAVGLHPYLTSDCCRALSSQWSLDGCSTAAQAYVMLCVLRE